MSQHVNSVRFSLRRLLVVVLAVAIAAAIYAATVGRPPIVKLFGSVENMAIVREATRVEAYRLAPPKGFDTKFEDVSPLDYEVVSGAIVASDEMAQRLKSTLLSPDTYLWDVAKACGYPVYGVKASFIRGDDRVDVYFCFGCSMLAVVRDQTAYIPEDFDNGERVFIEAVKELFPDDAEIQAIRE